MGVFKEIPKSDGTTTLFYRLDGDRNTVEVGSTYGLGTIDYEGALNKPSINGVTLAGDKTAEDLGLQRAGAIPDGIVLEENLGSGFEIDDDGIITVAGDFENVLEVKSGEEIMNAPADYNGTVICSSSYGNAERGNIYVLENGKIVETLISVSESGGIVINTNNSETITPLELNVALGTEVKLRFNYKSLTNGKGVAKLYMNNALRATKTITMGENEFDITDYVKTGINVFTVEVTDSNNFTVMIDYLVNGVSLTLKSNFNANMVYDNKVEYRYVVVGAGVKTVHFLIDDEEVGTQEVKATGEEAVYNLTNLKHGAQKFEVYATTVVDDVLITSNTLTYKLLFAVKDDMTPIVSSTFNKTECIEGELLNIDYIIYNPAETITNGYLQIIGPNGDGEQTPIKADRSLHYWDVNNYPIGNIIFKIGCGDTALELPMTVSELEIDIEPATTGLELYLTAANRSNEELEVDRPIWTYEDTTTTFTDLNWVSNGWIDGSLKLTGAARATVNFNIFAEDIRTTGKTIDFEFETHNVSALNSVLISCWAEEKGIKITSTECIMASEQETIVTRFKENERTRITITIESLNSHRMIKTYVDGVLSGIAQYTNQDNFQHANPVGITFNEGGEEIDIRSIRVYNTALSNRQVLTNYIYDIQDITEKIIKYNVNSIYDADGGINWGLVKSKIPTMYITGELPTSKGAPTTVTIDYHNPFVGTDSFDKPYENCALDIQGTSSVYYPRKNYQITFPERFSFYQGAIPEYEYTMKADYMESSHAHNTGNAIFVNNLYEEYFPTQAEGNGVRNTIYGFPCVIFLRPSEDVDQYEYIGVYNFNNDKNSPATLGLTTDKAESWEFKNNTSAHCLLRSDDFSAEAKPEENFEARYPKGLRDYSALQRVVSWIVSTENNLTKFRDEFDQYFNLHYCLIYYVMMDFGLLMDSRAKNMFFDTVDGLIWYPRFYDIDTAYGLNNEGVLDFGYGLEQTDENIYNGRNSLFWNNFQEVFMKDIADMYLSLRMSEKLSYDAALAVFEQHQRSQISEANYNEDAAWKYLTPLYETGDTTYLYVVQGSRIQHFKWWIANRIKYLDSKYEAPDFTKDFITMRLYTRDGNFKITPYIDTYIKCRFGSADVKVRAKAGQEIGLNAPEGLEFNDTETIIFGGSNISSLGDLSSKYAGTVDIKAGAKLKELIIGNSSQGYSNPHLKILSLGSNDLLTKVDVSNCPNLTGSLDMSGCKKLQEVWAEGTGITGITFVDGGDLRELHLPTTITNLTIKNHINLTEVYPTVFDNLQTLVLKNSRLDAANLLFNNLNTLTRLYCSFQEEANVVLNTMVIDTLIEDCGGMDDNGLNTKYPNLQGYMTVRYPSSMASAAFEQLQKDYTTYFPDLHITYESETPYYTYNSSGNYVQLATNVSLTETLAFPAKKRAAAILNLQDNAINDNTYFLINHTASATSYNKSAVKTIIIPGGYNYYSITMIYFDKLERIIWPREGCKLKTFSIDNTTSGDPHNIKEFDFSIERNFDLTELGTMRIKVGGTPVEKISLRGQVVNTTGEFFGNLIYSGYADGATLRLLDCSNMSLPNKTSFGNLQSTIYTFTHPDCVVDFTNLNMPNLTNITESFYAVEGFGTVIFDGARFDKLTTLAFPITHSSITVADGGEKEFRLNNVFVPMLNNISRMFYRHGKLEKVTWQGLDTSNVTVMNSMFYECSKLKDIDLSILRTEKVTDMGSMFYNCASLPYIGTENWIVPNIKNMASMFYQCSSLTELKINHFNISQVETLANVFCNCSSLARLDLSEWNTSNVKSLEKTFSGCASLVEIKLDNWDTQQVITMASLFNGCTNLSGLELGNFNTMNVTTISSMFNGCKALANLSIKHFIVDNVLTMDYMFAGCETLQVIDLSEWNTSKVTTMSYMFSDCHNLTSININSWDTSAVTNMSYMFNNCYKMTDYTSILTIMNTSNVTNMSYMFRGNSELVTIDLNLLDLSKVTTVQCMFQDCKKLQNIDLRAILERKNITNINNVIANCISIKALDFSDLDATHITNADNAMNGCTGIEEIKMDNANIPLFGAAIWSIIPTLKKDFISGTAKLGSVSFNSGGYYQNLTILPNVNYDTLDLSGYSKLTVSCSSGYFSFLKESTVKNLIMCPVQAGPYNSQVTGISLSSFFSGQKTIEHLELNGFAVTGNTMTYGFNAMTNLKTITGLETLETQGVKSFQYFFQACSSLETVDITKMNFVSATDFTSMFYQCTGLKTLDLTNLGTPVLTTMTRMFGYNHSLQEVIFTGMNLGKVTNISYMFAESLMEDLDISTFNPTAATTTTYVFNNCKQLKRLDLSGITWAKNQSFSNFFNNCISLEYLDIRNWDVSKITTLSNYTNFFQYVPYTCTIVVKNEACRTWVKARRTDFVNVKLPSEL